MEGKQCGVRPLRQTWHAGRWQAPTDGSVADRQWLTSGIPAGIVVDDAWRRGSWVSDRLAEGEKGNLDGRVRVV